MAFTQRAHLIYPAAGLSAAMQDAVANAYANTLQLETFANERLMFTKAASASADYGATETHRQISSAMTPALATALKTALAGMSGNWYIVDADSGALLDTNDTNKKPGVTVTKQLTWAAGVAYMLNEVVSYNGQPYQVIQAHTSKSDWRPDISFSLFKRYVAPGEVSEFRQPQGAHDAYPLNARVTHNGKTWKSAIAANVWEPGAVGSEALWTDESAPPGPQPWVQGVYALDALVTHNGRTWKSLIAANSYEPGVVGTWRDTAVPPLWVAPSGAVGAWAVNDVVEYNGFQWKNTVANNSFAPNVYGWTKL